MGPKPFLMIVWRRDLCVFRMIWFNSEGDIEDVQDWDRHRVRQFRKFVAGIPRGTRIPWRRIQCGEFPVGFIIRFPAP